MASFSPILKQLHSNPYLARRMRAPKPDRPYNLTSTSSHHGGQNMSTRASPAPTACSHYPSTTSRARTPRRHLYHQQPLHRIAKPESGVFVQREKTRRAEGRLWKRRSELVAKILGVGYWSLERKDEKIRALGQLSWDGEQILPPPALPSLRMGCGGVEEEMGGQMYAGSRLRNVAFVGEGMGLEGEMGGMVPEGVDDEKGGWMKIPREMDEEEARELERFLEEELWGEAVERERGGWVMGPQCMRVVDGVWKMARGG